jgi:L-alanine-DL-glutamate epimerase-like enolase superfamily enzyme
MRAVKIKIGENFGRNPKRDLHRVALARDTIGPSVALMVDANGGYQAKQAIQLAGALAEWDVVWFEEPVSSDHLDQLATIRAQVQPEVAAGEYGTSPRYFHRMCAAGAVDCLQVDATRCGGYTGFLAAAAVADVYGLQVSAHCAPYLHAPVCAAVPNLRHLEWFADHVRVEQLLFGAGPAPHDGQLNPSGPIK